MQKQRSYIAARQTYLGRESKDLHRRKAVQQRSLKKAEHERGFRSRGLARVDTRAFVMSGQVGLRLARHSQETGRTAENVCIRVSRLYDEIILAFRQS